MKGLVHYLSKKLLKNMYINKMFFIATIFIFTSSFFIHALAHQDTALPENPLDHFAEDSSFVPLQGNDKHLLEDVNDETNDEHTDHNEDEQEAVDGDEEEDHDMEKEREEENENDQTIDEAGDEGQKAPLNKNGGTTSEKLENEDASHIEIIDDSGKEDLEEEKRNQYFTTTIVDGEIVTEENYVFRIIQLKHDFIVLETEVFHNGKPIDDFDGALSLKEGNNAITIKVTYQDADGKTFTVTKHYTVILNTKDIIIYTDLEDEAVTEDRTMTFTASAKYDGKSVPVVVEVNGKKAKHLSDDRFEATLNENENNIEISATYRGNKAKKQLTVYYQPKTSKLTIETDLKDQTVTEEQFTFFAIAKDGNRSIPLSAKLNGEPVTGDGEGHFVVKLKEGRNTIVLAASNSSGTIEQKYTVNYNLPDGGSKDEAIDSEIYLEFPDLKDGQKIRNSVHTFHVKAVDKNGKQITDRKITISATNNGKRIPVDWNNNSLVSFTLSVEDGTNFIEVTAKDKDGNIATVSLTVYGEIASDDEPIGTITFSLEATTIGLGYIIPPQEIELYPNERGSKTIDRIFKKYGIDYEYTGDHENGFYLSVIKKPGLVTNPKIPDDLAELLERDFAYFDPNNYDPNSLGEFDFTNGSGWMYSVNGHYPNVGFSNYYFKDGDVVRIRFTLALGKDIGGGPPGTNYGKEW